MAMTCWICDQPLVSGEPRITVPHIPHRLRRYRGEPVHLRCFDRRDEGLVEVHAPSAPLARTRRPASAPSAEGPLFAEDLARLRAISRYTAWRWLVRLEERYGAIAVGGAKGRRGPRRFTTAAALERILRRSAGEAEAVR